MTNTSSTAPRRELEAARWKHGDRDRRLLNRSLLEATSTSADEHRPPAECPSFTRRESEILQLLPAGWSNREIGFKVDAPTSSVKADLSRLYKKLGVTNRMQAATWVTTHGDRCGVRPRP
jgi:DNA-binding NarL/FixJ family response regulator